MGNPDVFESLVPGSGQYSCKRDLRLNAWLLVASVAYLAQMFLLRRHPEWSPLTRGLVALGPLIPALLYIRAWVRFIRGMDELQRRVQMEAQVFAAWGTLLVGIVITTLNQHGVLHFLPHGLGFGGVMVSVFSFWLVGVVVANRRYK